MWVVAFAVLLCALQVTDWAVHGCSTSSCPAAWWPAAQAQASRPPSLLNPSPPCLPAPQVVGSPPEGLVDTFFELMPQGSPSDFQRMLDLKVGRMGGRLEDGTLLVAADWLCE